MRAELSPYMHRQYGCTYSFTEQDDGVKINLGLQLHTEQPCLEAGSWVDLDAQTQLNQGQRDSKWPLKAGNEVPTQELRGSCGKILPTN